ncbi:tyrosine-protein phosphatase [Mesobaculum littorinae]|nr:tyrosine-protein phosphatase [Mesobaculum littorinae]
MGENWLGRATQRVKAWERRVSWSFGDDISTPAGRRAAWRHFHLVDHAFVRLLWTNLHEIAPGAWRANQPSPRRIGAYARMGIRSIISLRGDASWSYTLFEREACAQHRVTLHLTHLGARKLATREKLLHLLHLFDTVERPFLMHCKSGADRTGLAAALFLLDQQGASLERARAELHWRYLHRKGSKAGILDHLLDVYEAESDGGRMSVRQWIETCYDPARLTDSFRAERATR